MIAVHHHANKQANSPRAMAPNLEPYLASSTYIDWRHPAVAAQAAALTRGLTGDENIAHRCFAFVRDEIAHSWDHRRDPVTCKASDVLAHGTGYCYAKSHLLAALLRANGIPAGLCYQRLTIENDRPPCSLHGLNAVWLQRHGWYRIDARGNKPGIDAQFRPPAERLAFAIETVWDRDFSAILAAPHPAVVQVLTECRTVAEVFARLPDAESISPDASSP